MTSRFGLPPHSAEAALLLPELVLPVELLPVELPPAPLPLVEVDVAPPPLEAPELFDVAVPRPPLDALPFEAAPLDVDVLLLALAPPDEPGLLPHAAATRPIDAQTPSASRASIYRWSHARGAEGKGWRSSARAHASCPAGFSGMLAVRSRASRRPTGPPGSRKLL